MKSIVVYDKVDKNSEYYCVAYLKTNGFREEDKSYLFDIILYDNKWKPVLFINDFKGYVSLEVDKDVKENIQKALGVKNSVTGETI